MSANRSMYTV